MIELTRLVRLMPKNLATVRETDDKQGLVVTFKRFDPETGAELEPEISEITWAEVLDAKEKRVVEIEILGQLLTHKS